MGAGDRTVLPVSLHEGKPTLRDRFLLCHLINQRKSPHSVPSCQSSRSEYFCSTAIVSCSFMYNSISTSASLEMLIHT